MRHLSVRGLDPKPGEREEHLSEVNGTQIRAPNFYSYF
jgi:hypothetical protein